MGIQSYQDLVVWQKSMDLSVEIYRLTAQFPKAETYGIASQMRRASVSVPSNIAGGSKRGSRKDFRNFLVIAYGSGAELETQLLLAKRLKLAHDSEYEKSLALLAEVMKMLNALIRKLE